MASAIIFATFLLALALGVMARRGRDLGLEQWAVAGRGFGSVFVFLLLAGEIYTTFTFLGGSGLAYREGAPAYYILAYGTVAYSLSYFMLPPIWRYAREHGLLTQPDFFARKYDSRLLELLVAVVGVVALIPYLVLQLRGLGIIISTASYGAISSDAAVWIGSAVMALYVVISGVRGSAWTATLKDVVILVVVVFLGIYLPLHYYGGFEPMFRAIDQAKPGFLTLRSSGMSLAWYDSTVALTALGFFMWPHSFAAVFTAREDGVFRRNAILLPFYQLILLFVFFVGFAAVLQTPGLTGPQGDLALFKLSIATFPSWVVGLIGAAGVLTAIVPGSLIVMTASTLIANNLVRVAAPSASEAAIGTIARGMVPLVTLAGAYFALFGGATIVALLLMGYAFVTQFFPALIASLMPRNPVTREGAIAGIVAGVGAVAYVSSSHTTFARLFPELPEVVRDLNIGIVALALNVVVLLAVSALTQDAAGRRPARS